MNRIHLLYYITGVYALTCGLFYWHQTKGTDRLRQEQAQMRSTIEEAGDLRNKPAPRSGKALDREELIRLRSAHRELIKLRGQVASLREYASMDNVQIQSEIKSLTSEQHIEVQAAELLESRQGARKLSKATQQILRTYVQTLHGASDGPFATSFEELERSVLENPNLQSFWKNNLKELTAISPTGLSAKDTFEFLPQGLNARKYGNETLLLREKSPRAIPDGGWTRAYASSEAKVIELLSTTTDFTEAESQYLDLNRR
jgi:glycerophosphoryl diester phosphodiesterase